MNIFEYHSTKNLTYDPWGYATIDFSLRDPIIEFYSKTITIQLPNRGNTGILLVDGTPIFYQVNDMNPRIYLNSPAYFITNDRSGVCYDAAQASYVLLKKAGYNVSLLQAETTSKEGHNWVELRMNNQEYVVNFAQIFKKDFYFHHDGSIIKPETIKVVN